MAQITNRRYDIDWIRVIAIGLLLVYHVAIGFQSWGMMIAFITSEKSLDDLWIPMSMLSVWRIPLLFFVSGMGVYFALRNRSWKELIAERARRILVPFIFGALVLVPIHIYLWKAYYHFPNTYTADPGHLWFLGNIFIYVLVLSPLFIYLKRNEDGGVARFIKKIFSNPLGLFVVTGTCILEALIIKPYPYELYSMTWHGFFLGFLAFFFGFCFVLAGDGFWNMISKYRWLFVIIALTLFLLRTFYFKMGNPVYLLVTESDCWIMSVLAFGYKYLNRPGKALTYLSSAAYPVYILHMLFLYLSSMWVFTLAINPWIQFVMVLVMTVGGCLASYEVIRRLKWMRPLFGLGIETKSST